MTYLYAGLGVALLVPLMALVQTLISVAQLDREGNDLALLQIERQIIIANGIAKEFRSTKPSKINESTSCMPYYGTTFESGCYYFAEIEYEKSLLKLRVELSLLKSQFEQDTDKSLKKDNEGFYVPKSPLLDPVTYVDVKSCWVPGSTQEC